MEAFTALQKLQQRFPEAFPPALLDSFAAKLRRVQRRLDDLSFQGPGFRASDITPQGTGRPQIIDQGEIDFGPGRKLIADLERRLDRLTVTFAEKLRASVAGSLARAFDRGFRALGQSVAQGLFGGGRGPGVASQRLRLFNAKKQMRSLRQALRQGQISYKAFSLRVKAQQRRIQKQQERLNETMQSGFVGALESMGDAAKRIFKQLIADITAAVAKMAVLKALVAAFNISSGGFAGALVTQLGGGAFLPGGKATTSSVAAPSPKMRSGALTLNVVGELRGEGRSIKATLDRQANAQSQFGR
jgi:hypothetical protein